MSRRARSLGGFVAAVLVTLLGSVATGLTFEVQQALASRDVVATATVESVEEGRGRFDADSIRVSITQPPRTLELTHFRGDPQPADRLLVRYDPDDPTAAVQEGVSVWGAQEVFLAFLAVSGLVASVIEGRRLRHSSSRRRHVPRSDPPQGGPVRESSPWTAKAGQGRRRRRRR